MLYRFSINKNKLEFELTSITCLRPGDAEVARHGPCRGQPALQRPPRLNHRRRNVSISNYIFLLAYTVKFKLYFKFTKTLL